MIRKCEPTLKKRAKKKLMIKTEKTVFYSLLYRIKCTELYAIEIDDLLCLNDEFTSYWSACDYLSLVV